MLGQSFQVEADQAVASPSPDVGTGRSARFLWFMQGGALATLMLIGVAVSGLPRGFLRPEVPAGLGAELAFAPSAFLGGRTARIAPAAGSSCYKTVPAARAGVTMGLAVGDQFPASALKTCGVAGKKAVVFFYGADDAPSCKKEISGFDGALDEFKQAGFTVVGVRNEKGVKDTGAEVQLVVDEGDAMRKEIGIAPDLFGLLGGRETYVLDSKGQIASVFNDQFGPDKHVSTALKAAEDMPEPAKKPNFIDQIMEKFGQ